MKSSYDAYQVTVVSMTEHYWTRNGGEICSGLCRVEATCGEVLMWLRLCLVLPSTCRGWLVFCFFWGYGIVIAINVRCLGHAYGEELIWQ